VVLPDECRDRSDITGRSVVPSISVPVHCLVIAGYVLLTALIVKVYERLENKDTVHINNIDLRQIEIRKRIIPKIYRRQKKITHHSC
jgi:hypothetical protein